MSDIAQTLENYAESLEGRQYLNVRRAMKSAARELRRLRAELEKEKEKLKPAPVYTTRKITFK